MSGTSLSWGASASDEAPQSIDSSGSKRKLAPIDTWMHNRHALVRQMVSTQRNLSGHFLLNLSIPANRREAIICHRIDAVELIASTCERFALQPLTAGLAVRYFDLFIEKRAFLPTNIYPLVGLSCVLVAAKMWDQSTPSLDQLIQADLALEVTLDDLRMSEIDLLQHLNWRLLLASPHSFLDVFITVFCLYDEPGFDVKKASFVIDMSCYVCESLSYPEPVIAAAAMLCSWPCSVRAQAMLKYLAPLADWCSASPSDILGCKEVLLLHYIKEFCRNNDDSVGEGPHKVDRAESPDSVMALWISDGTAATADTTELPAFDTPKVPAIECCPAPSVLTR